MELKFILEAVLFSAQQPLSPKELKGILSGAVEHSEEQLVKAAKKASLDEITTALTELEQEHAQAQRSYRLACVAGSWQFVSQPEYAPWIKALVGHKARPPRLSQPALETLAIIAYRQPITRAEIEQVRGVAVDGVLQTLLDRGLIEQLGRAEVPGRPMTFGTTGLFLQYFGLATLEDLPAADELRRIPVTKPEGLLTVDPGLATAPPEQLRLGDNGRPEPGGPAAPEPGEVAGDEPKASDAEPAAASADHSRLTPSESEAPPAPVPDESVPEVEEPSPPRGRGSRPGSRSP